MPTSLNYHCTKGYNIKDKNTTDENVHFYLHLADFVHTAFYSLFMIVMIFLFSVFLKITKCNNIDCMMLNTMFSTVKNSDCYYQFTQSL